MSASISIGSIYYLFIGRMSYQLIFLYEVNYPELIKSAESGINEPLRFKIGRPVAKIWRKMSKCVDSHSNDKPRKPRCSVLFTLRWIDGVATQWEKMVYARLALLVIIWLTNGYKSVEILFYLRNCTIDIFKSVVVESFISALFYTPVSFIHSPYCMYCMQKTINQSNTTVLKSISSLIFIDICQFRPFKYINRRITIIEQQFNAVIDIKCKRSIELVPYRAGPGRAGPGRAG